jgi:hypothetical protein
LSRWTGLPQATRPRLCGTSTPRWSPEPDVITFIQCSRRRGMPPPVIIHAPNSRTTNKTTAADKTATHESVDRRPPDTSLAGSRDRRDDQATCPLTPLVGERLR